MKIAVAICTWNRAKLLDQTLAEMRKLVIPEGIEWELIVVNNNSTDDTEAVLERYSEKLPLVSLFERRSGKSYAANLALEYVSGELLIWTDDDVLPEPCWIVNYLAAAKRWPEASFFAGAIDPWYESDPPNWARKNIDRLGGVYVIANYGAEERKLTPSDGVFGANMAFRTDVAKSYPLNPALGRTKGELVGGDDTELVQRVTAAGHFGVWVPSAKVRHFVPTARLNKPYLWKWYRGAGRNFVINRGIGESAELCGVPRWVLKEFTLERLKAVLWSPLANERWFNAFTKAARMWGVMQEYKQRKKQAAAV